AANPAGGSSNSGSDSKENQLATAILNKKASPNKLIVDEATNDDNSVCCINSSLIEKLGFFRSFSHIISLVIQSLSFGLLPLFGFASSQLLGLIPWMDKLLSNGLTVALCMPTTISSNVIMTTNARGNTAVSLINATLGNVLGVFVAPLLIKLYLGNTVSLAFDKIMLEMSFTVLAPLILGQLVRYLFVHYGCICLFVHCFFFFFFFSVSSPTFLHFLLRLFFFLFVY
ncbi:hypothetical protein HMI55_001511, partial [Coelomomyces lativittatus]